MSSELLLTNAANWALQVLLLVGVAGMTLAILRAGDPRLRLWTWQTVLLLSLSLPLITPWTNLAAAGPSIDSGAADWSIPWGHLLAAVVGGGILLRLIRLAVGMARLGGLRRRATAWWPAWFPALAARIGASAMLGASREIESAVTFGLIRPSVLVPDALAAASEPHQRAVVAHELFHVVRRDWAWLLAEEAVRTLLWWHPAIWIAVAEARQAREEIVDRHAIAAVGDRDGYLEALVAAAEHRGAHLAGFVPHFYRRNQLKSRVRRLLKENHMSPMRMLVCAAIIAVAVPATVWAGGSAFPLASAGGEVVQQDPPPPPPPPPPPQRVTKKNAAGEQFPPPPPPPPPQRKNAVIVKKVSKSDGPPPPPPPAPERLYRVKPIAPKKVIKEPQDELPPPPPPAPKGQKLAPKIIKKDAPLPPKDGRPVVKDEKLVPKVIKKGGGA